MVSQHELGRKFRRGDTSGTASNVSLITVPGATQLIGYGHAVYAERRDADGHITYFEGWYGYSVSTSCQHSKLGLRAAADTISDDRPSRSGRALTTAETTA